MLRPGRGTFPGLKTASRDLQPVGSPTGGARSLHVWPQGGDRLGADTLKPAQHLVGRPQASPNAQNMLVKSPRGISADLRATRPSLLAVGLDSLNGGL